MTTILLLATRVMWFIAIWFAYVQFGFIYAFAVVGVWILIALFCWR